MRKIILGLLLLCPALLAAQLTTVTGTVTDPGGLVYRFGTVTAFLVISGTPQFVSNGAPYIPPSEPTGIDDDGHFVMRLADNTQLTPAGSTWTFRVCSARGTVQPHSGINRSAVCFDVTGVTISGSSQDISAILSAAALPLVEKGIEGGTAVQINGITLPNKLVNWVGKIGTPPVCLTPTPTNGRCISFFTSGSNVSAFLIGDGTTNCLSGTGTYVTCGGGTGGGVGAGTIGQLAGYSTTSSVTGANFFFNAGSTPPTSTVGIGGIGISTGGVVVFDGGADATYRRLTSINSVGGTAISTPSISLVNPGTTPPTLPANALGLNFLAAGASTGVTNVAAFLQGNGVATNCLIGTGVFAPCPSSGTAGVTSINSVGGAFTFTGTGVSCATTTCTFTASTGGGLSGSGSPGFFPIFTNSTTLGNGAMNMTFNAGHAATIQMVDASTGLPLAPNANVGTGISTGVETEVTASIASCGGTSNTPGTNAGCSGDHVYYAQASAANAGVNAAVYGQNIGSASGGAGGLLNIGVFGSTTTQSNVSEERAGYFEANDSSLDTGTTTIRVGAMGVANNATTRTTALNEGLAAQTGVSGSGSINTQDFSMHCLAPVLSSGGVFTAHACLKIEPQGTGVEFQTGAHTFAALPACTATYEGSLAAITDSTVTSGTITGGGTNHVLGFCNGTAWVVSGGGGGAGTAPIRVGVCTSTGGGNCNVTFTPAWNSPPVCTMTPNNPTVAITSFNFVNLDAVAFSITYAPTNSVAAFQWICVGNPN